jgi:hypothetical protein
VAEKPIILDQMGGIQYFPIDRPPKILKDRKRPWIENAEKLAKVWAGRLSSRSVIRPVYFNHA